MKIATILATTALVAAFASQSALAFEPAGAKDPTEALVALGRENAQLQEKLKSLESSSISTTALTMKNCRKLKEVAADVRRQRETMADFEAYVKWMSANMAGYSKYIAAGSAAAGFAKVLPIPYAGQASVFTKFVSSAALSLTAASVSINNYLGASHKFISRVDALDVGRGVSAAEVSDLVRFADGELLKGMVDVQEKLASTAELSASSLAFLESLNHYLGTSEEYWAKTKSLLKSGDDKKEKSFLSESAASLKNRALAFNGRLKGFAEAVQKDAPVIKSLVAYDELIREMEPKLARAR